MNIEYIIVQAGGKGIRMEHLTANKPKALVPVGNLPMIFHLFKKYPEKKYLIISDFKIDVMRKYLEAFANIKYLVISTEDKKGTCSGIASAIQRIPNNHPFALIWSDLVLSEDFEFPEREDDYLGISKDFICRWRYEEDKLEEIPSQDKGVAGFFIFKDKEKLVGVPEEGELVKWMQSREYVFKTVDLYHTKEYGVIAEWVKLSQGQMGSRCRPFNSMTITGDIVTKKGNNEQGKLLEIREKAWYRLMEEKGFEHIPIIYSYEPFQMQRIHGHNIFEYSFSHEQKKDVIKKLVDCLKKLHLLGEEETDYFSIKNAYIGKTFERLEKVRNMIPFSNQEYITVNEKRCRNVFFYRDELEKKFEEYRCDVFKVLHGDNTFSNMMLDEKLNPILIDPRGYFGYTEIYGDTAYDWAKLYYSIVGNYDKFNLKKFNLDIMETKIVLTIESNGWEDIKDYFLKIIGDEISEDKIKLIHAIIWLSLTTYAWEDYDSVCGAFYNGLYYLEEIL